MENVLAQYPKYTSGQFLTNTNLNDSFNYLGQQLRWTRHKILGKGIFEGFSYNYNNSGAKVTSVVVNSGTGITSDGFLIYLPKAEEFNYLVDFKKLSPSQSYPIGTSDLILTTFPFEKGFRLLNEEQAKSDEFKDFAIEINLAVSEITSKYCLALYHEIIEVHTKNCAPGECNTSGDYFNVRTMPILVEKVKAVNKTALPQPFLMLPSLQEISKISSENAFRKKINDSVSANNSLIKDKLKSVIVFSKDFIPKAITDEADAIFSKSGFLNFEINSSFNQYYLNFARDIQKAINEYICFYNNEKTDIETLNAIFYPKLLMLGFFPISENDEVRNYWIPAKAYHCTEDKKKHLEVLFSRIFILAKSLMNENELFDGMVNTFGTNLSERIRITPGKHHYCELGNFSIGYYYNLIGASYSNQLLTYWDTEPNNSYLSHIFNYWDVTSLSDVRKQQANPFLNDLAGMDFYRIEGHIGLKPDEVYKVLLAKIGKLNLPLKLVMIDITNETLVGFREKYELFLEAYKKFLKDLKSTDPTNTLLTSYKKPFEKLSYALNDISYKDVVTVKNLLNDVQSYTNIFISLSQPRDVAVDRSKIKGQIDSVIGGKITELLNKNKITELRKDIYSLLPKGEAEKGEITLDDFMGLEYLGGVCKGGTFIIVHNKCAVLGDFTVPYFFTGKV